MKKRKKRQAITDTTDHLENCGVVSEKDDGRLNNTGLWRWRDIYGFEKFSSLCNHGIGILLMCSLNSLFYTILIYG